MAGHGGERFAQLSAPTQFLVGATLGVGMSFGRAVLAVTLGCVILEVVAVLTGVIGAREGLSTTLLTRWTGFGSGGSALVGLVVAVTSAGWVGVQDSLFAQGLARTSAVRRSGRGAWSAAPWSLPSSSAASR